MGEVSEMILEGILCQSCGELVGGDTRTVGAVGFPRSCDDCGRKHKKHFGDHRSVKCPVCKKRLKSEQGVRDHIRDVHDGKE